MKHVLDSFELFYEEMEKKPVPKQIKQNLPVARPTRTMGKPKVVVDKSLSTKEVSLREHLSGVTASVRSRINNIKKNRSLHRKKVNKQTKLAKMTARKEKMHGIIGIGLLFVVVSIAYSTYQTNLFVDGWQMVVALFPQVTFALAILIYAFYKIYK